MANNRREEIMTALTKGITELTSSDRWQQWLDIQSRFHHYSFNNVLLILQQRPEASRVAGFNAWVKMNRYVRKGEKGIWILAPMVYKTNERDDDASSTGKVLRGFKPVPVFDVAQTDGEELPTVCERLVGDDPADVFPGLCTVAQGLGFTVEDADFDGKNGDCSHMEHRIRVARDRSPVQRVKTLAHELGHALLHESFDDRSVAELEAESVAYIVCHEMGIASDDYTFGYVATWAGGSDEALAAIKTSGSRIQKAADQILSSIGQATEVAA